MIIDKIVEDVEIDNEAVTKEFTIAATAHSFRVLYDNLYSNKIKAVLRELSTNAVDAHIHIGKGEIPFVVHLPTKFEPSFSVRDFGPGMSDDEILNLYSTYFKSASYKIQSNFYAGCYGLGSKTPFAVSNSFNVTSFQHGIKRLYSCYIDEKGIPTVARLGEFNYEKDDQDGLLVELPVKEDDIETYKDEAASLFTHFKVKPTVTGVNDFKVNTVDYELVETNWALRHYNGKSFAIIGDISYPIDKNNITDLSNEYESLLNCSLDLTFDIGELSITPSREQLSYDNKTIVAIKQRLDEISLKVKDIVEEKISKAHSAWNAACIYNELFRDKNNGINRLVTAIGISGIKWNGISVAIQNLRSYDLQPSTVFSIYETRGRYNYRRNAHARRIKCEKQPYYISATSKTCLLINDVEKGGITQARRLVKNYTYHKVYLITCPNKQEEETVLKALGATEQDVVRLSTIPKPPRKLRESGFSYAKKTKVLLLQNSNDTANYSYWDEISGEELEKLDSGTTFLVELFRYEAIVNREKVFPYKLVEIGKFLQQCGINAQIIGVRKNVLEALNKEFKNLYDFVLSLVKQKFEKEDFSQNIADNDEYNDNINNNDTIKQIQDLLGLTDDESLLYDKFIKSATDGKNYLKWKNLANFVNYSFAIKLPQIDCSSFKVKLLNKYPLLKHIDLDRIYTNDKLKEELLHYLDLVKLYEKELTNVSG